MNSHHCCQGSARQEGVRLSSPLKRIYGALEWALPGAVLVAVPKCPACVAAYVALATGVGISFSTAAQLRLLLIALCVSALAYLAAKRASGLLLRWRRLRSL
jgi:hypothetical protein